jgi:hypothetical protein
MRERKSGREQERENRTEIEKGWDRTIHIKREIERDNFWTKAEEEKERDRTTKRERGGGYIWGST